MTTRIIRFRSRKQLAETLLNKIGHVPPTDPARVICPLCSARACAHTDACLITRVKREMGITS